MGNDFKKQTSTISANQALEALLAHGFVVGEYQEMTPIADTKQAYRKDILAARRRFGERAAISNTGRSIVMVGNHIVNGRAVEVDVPLFGMLGHGARESIEQKTGVSF